MEVNYINHRNNAIIDMFKNANSDNLDSIITQIHMGNSKIYLRFEQTGEIIEPETHENKRTVPTASSQPNLDHSRNHRGECRVNKKLIF